MIRRPKIRMPWSYLTWPNRITLVRLLLVPPFVVLMLHQQGVPLYRYLALGIFVGLALSDIADGYLARRHHMTSRLGAILDPLADKSLIICAAVLLALPHSGVEGLALPDWVVVAIVGKDLWVIVGFALIFVLTGRVHILPSLPGKICTAGQAMMVGAMLASPELNLLGYNFGTLLAKGLWLAVVALSALAVLAYTRQGLRFVADTDANQRRPAP